MKPPRCPAHQHLDLNDPSCHECSMLQLPPPICEICGKPWVPGSPCLGDMKHDTAD